MYKNINHLLNKWVNLTVLSTFHSSSASMFSSSFFFFFQPIMQICGSLCKYFVHWLTITACRIRERQFGEEGCKRPVCRLQGDGTQDSYGWRVNIPHWVKLHLRSKTCNTNNFKYLWFVKRTRESLLLHNPNRQKDRLAKDTWLWLLSGQNTSNSLTNSYLMMCRRSISFLFYHYSVDIMWGNKLKDDWSGKWLLVYCNSV